LNAEKKNPEKVASKDGTPIAVWRSGEGPPLEASGKLFLT
jgi:hypothetical protein